MKNKSSLSRTDYKPAKTPNTPNSLTQRPVRDVTHEEISARAQILWEQRGRPRGLDDEIWLQAERQLGAGELHDSEDDIDDANKIEERLGDTGEQTNPRSSTSL